VCVRESLCVCVREKQESRFTYVRVFPVSESERVSLRVRESLYVRVCERVSLRVTCV